MTSSGQNVTDGTYSIKFSLYDAASGGNRLYTSSGTTASPTAISVTVANGLFSVLIGDSGQNALNIDWNQDTLYLGVTVGSDSEMSPRKRLSSVPFAFNSETLQGNYASSGVTGAGGALMTLHQTSTTAATADRTALLIQTDGTSNGFDYLLKGTTTSTGDVFTINRLGNTTTTGNFAVLGNTTLGNQTSDIISVGGRFGSDLTPSQDLVYSLGTASLRWLGLNVGTVTSTNVFATSVSSTNGTFTNGTITTLTSSSSTITNLTFSTASGSTLIVGGKSVCLTDGTNCPAGVSLSGETLAAVSARGASATSTLNLYGGFVAASSTVTSTFTVAGNSSLQGTTFTSATGTSVTTTNLSASFGTITNVTSTFGNITNLVGTSVTTTNLFSTNGQITNLSSSNATITGGSINGTVIGNTTPAAGTFTNLSFTNGTSTSWFGFATASGTTVNATNSFINTLNSNSITAQTFSSPSVSITGGSITNLTNLSFANGTSTGWLGFATASGTTVNATNSFINSLNTNSLLVTGQTVCLANGTNCPGTAASTSTLQQITNSGATTTNQVYLQGGFIAASSTVTSNFVVTGPSTMATTTFTGNVGIGAPNPNYKLGITSSASGTSINGLTVAVNDSAAGVSHTSKFFTQQLGAGAGRTLFYAASPDTTTNSGEFDIVTEGGGNYLSQSSYVSGSGAKLDLYNTSSAGISLNTYGNSYFTGGNFGIGTTSPSSTFDVIGSGRFTGGVTSTSIDSADGFFTALAANSLLVTGQTVCLSNGTNCPAGTSLAGETLAAVSARGASATSTFSLYGGFVAASSTVTSTFTVAGNSSLQGTTFTSATGTSVTTTNLSSSFGTITNVTSTFGNITNLVDTSVTTTNLFSTNGQITNLSSSNATITGGSINGTVIGNTTPAAGTFTNLSFTNGTSTSWFGFATASGTTVNATNSFISTLNSNSVTAQSFSSPNITVTGGTLNNTVIGGVTPAAGTFTNVSFTNGTSTGWLGFATASGTTVNATNSFINTLNSNSVTVAGQSVCLANGTNCPGTAASTSTLQQITNNGASTNNTLNLFGGFNAASSTVTSTFTVLGNTSLQGTTFSNATGTSVTTTNLFATFGTVTNVTSTFGNIANISGTNATITNLSSSNATITGGSINGTVIGNTTPAAGTFTNLSFTNGTSTSWFGFATASGTTVNATNSFINTLNSNSITAQTFSSPSVSITGGSVTNLTNLSFANGTSTSWLGFATASGTTVNATNSFINSLNTNSLTVTGQSVCLANGTNCPSTSFAGETLAAVTARGSSATSTLSLYGGFVAASSTVTSTFTVAGNTSLQGTTFTIATGTSVTTTNLFSTNGQVTNLSSSNATITGGSINGTVIGNTTPAAGTFTNLSFTNGTSTGWLGFATASGTTMNATNSFISTLNSNSVTAQTFSSPNITVTGGTLNNTVIGGVTPAAGTFTNVSFANGTSTSWLGFATASGTTVNATNSFINSLGTNSLTVSGQTVCLANGTNCPVSSLSGETLAAVTARGSSATSTLSLYGGFVAASSTVTSTFTVGGTSALYGNVGVGGASNPSYTLDVTGNGLFTGLLNVGNSVPTEVQGTRAATAGAQMILATTYAPTVGSIYSSGNAFLASNAYQTTDSVDAWQKGAPTYSSNLIKLGLTTGNNGQAFQLLNSPANASGTYGNTFTNTLLTVLEGGNVGIGNASPSYKLQVAGETNTTGLSFTYGTSSNWFGFATASGTTINATGGFINSLNTNSLLVTGQSVCLANGANCPGAAATTATLQTITNNGNITTNQIYLWSDPSSSTSAIARKYVESRTQNLVTNGSGLMGDNYNFSGFTYSQNEVHGGMGSFLKNAAYGVVTTDEYIPVDPTKNYRLVGWGKSGETGGANYNAGNQQYFGVAVYDIDGNNIDPLYYSKYAGSTDTTLAAQLNPGDTTITLTNATGWDNSADSGYFHNMAWYGYTNSKGYTYPNYTYTRNVSTNYSDFASNGLWSSGGISGNVITLRAPWPGPTLAAGTAVRNNSAGGTYKYIGLAAGSVPNDWTRYEGHIGGYDTTGSQNINQFPYGTAYIKLLFLVNYHGLADNNIRWSDVWFSEMSASNLEAASATTTGVVTLTNQTLGAGDKYFSGSVGIGTTSPAASLHVAGTNGAIFGSASGTAGTLALTSAQQGSPVSGRLSFGTDGTGWQFRIAKNTVGAVSDLLTVVDNGNVGIGTTSPSTTVDVIGSGRFTGVVTSTSVEAANGFISSLGTNSLLVTGQSVCLANGTNCPGTAASTSTLQQVTNNGATTTNLVYLQGGALAASSTFTNGETVLGTTRLLGNVGVGTSTPSQKLDVWGNLNVSTGTNPALFVDTGSGRVGIGTNAPAYSLDVVGGGRFTQALYTDSVVNMANTQYIFQRSGSGVLLGSTAANVYVSDAGSFGIGTTSPSSTFDVIGSGRFTGNVTSTSMDSADGFFTALAANSLLVAGQNVCLANGTNCPVSSLSGETLAAVTARGASATSTLSLYGGFVAASSTVTSTFTVAGNTSLQGTTFTSATGTNVTSTNLFSTFGTVTYVTSTNHFSTNFVGTSATTTNFFSTNGQVTNLSSSNVTITGGTINGTVIGGVNPAAGTFTNLSFSNGTSTSWLGFATASGTTMNATNSFINSLSTNSLFVTGKSVCLADGTNCAVSTLNGETLSAVSARGSSATSTLSLYGGFVAASSTVTSTFTVGGNSSLQGVTFTSGTGTSVTTTNLAATFGTITNATTTNLFSTLGRFTNAYSTLQANQSFTTVSTPSIGGGTGPNSVFVVGNYAYIANSTNGTLSILDITSPASPVVIGSVSTGAGSSDVIVSGRYAYVSAPVADQVVVVDVSNPSAPVVMSTVSAVSCGLNASALTGRFLYATCNNGSYGLVDVTDPANPTIVNGWPTSFGSLKDIATAGRYAYIAGYTSSTLYVIDTANPRAPVTAGTVSVGTRPTALAVSGRYVFTANEGNGTMSIVDVSNPASPSVVGTQGSLGTPSGIAVSGRYAVVTSSSTNAVYVVDVGTPGSPSLINSISVGSKPVGVSIAGRYALVTNQAGNTVSVIDLGGIETAGLVAHAAELGSLQVYGDTFAAGHVTIGGGLNVDAGGLFTSGAIGVASTNTTSTILFAVSSTRGEFSRGLTVNSVSVCLANGTNCIANVNGTTSSPWVDNGASNKVVLATTTRDVLMGGNTTSTAGFIWDFGENGTSTLLLGATTNTNVLIGTSTYGGGLNSLFTLSGNDLLVQGQIGSIGGMFSATSVVVGAGSTFYGDGNLYKTTAGDFRLAMNDAASGFAFYPGASPTAALTIASTTNVGVGRTVPSSALDVKGNITSILKAGDTMSQVATSTLTSGAYPNSIAIAGNYAYVVEVNASAIGVFDITNPSNPFQISTTTVLGSSPSKLAVNGRYLAVIDEGSFQVELYDISNPKNPAFLSLSATSDQPNGVYLAGNNLYIAVATGELYDYDITNVTSPTPVSVYAGWTSMSKNPQMLAAQGRYVYVTGFGDDTLNIFDYKDPYNPVQVATTTFTAGSGPVALTVSGRYAYVSNQNAGNIATVDISNPSAPVQVATTTILSTAGPRELVVSGRMLYVGNTGNSTVAALDISNPTAPQQVATTTVAGPVYAVALSGRYLYTALPTIDKLAVLDVGGIEVNGIKAASAEVGNLQVTNKATIANELIVGGSLSVGIGGVFTGGSFNSAATNTTSTINYALHVGNATLPSYLDVTGNVSNLLTAGQSFNVVTTTRLATSPQSGVAAQGMYVYTVDASGGSFNVIDVSDPTTPVTRGTVSLGSTGREIAVQGRYAYVTMSSANQIGIVDVSNPAAPTVVTTTYLGASATPFGIFGNGRFIYAAGQGGSLYALDVSNPVSPVLASALPLGGSTPHGVYVQGNYAYVTQNGSDNVKVVDVTNPYAPAIKGTAALPAASGPRGIYVNGSYAYVANQSSGSVSVINISNPLSPTTIKTMATVSAPFDIRVSGRYAYVANVNSSNSVTILDVATSSNPVIIGNVNLGVGSFTAVPNGRYVYVGNNNTTLSIIDTHGIETSAIKAGGAEIGNLFVDSNGVVGNNLSVANSLFVGSGGIASLGALSVASTNTTSTITYGLSVANNMIVGANFVGIGVTSTNSAFSVKGDISNILQTSSTFAVVTSTSSGGGVTYIDEAIQGNYLYMSRGSGWGFDIFDVTDGSNPKLVVSSSTTVNDFWNVRVAGKYLYGTSAIVDISNPAVPKTVGRLSAGFGLQPVLKGNYLIGVANSASALQVTDVSNPNAPFSVTTTASVATVKGIALQGNYLYVVNDNGVFSTIFVYDVTNPTNMARISSFATTIGMTGIAVEGRYVYLTNSNGNFYVYDASDPTALVFKGQRASTKSSLSGVTVAGRYAYLTHNTGLGNTSIVVMDVASSTNPIMLTSVLQNVSTPQKTVVSGQYLYVADLSGLEILYMKGAEFSSLSAHTAYLGQLDVRGSSNFTGDLSVWGNIYEQGSLTAMGDMNVGGKITDIYHTSDTFAVVTSTTAGYISTRWSTAFKIQGNYMYAPFTGTGVFPSGGSIYDISNPQYPRYVANAGASAFDVSGKYMVDNCASTYDITNPTNITSLYSNSLCLTVPLAGLKPHIDGNYVYGISGGSLLVTDITSPRAPATISQTTIALSLPTQYDFEIRGKYLYLVKLGGGTNINFQIYDISVPTSPQSLYAGAAPVSPNSIDVQGRYAYISGSTGTLAIVDISNPSTPALASTIPTGQLSSNNIVVSGRYAYMGEDDWSTTGTATVVAVDVSSSTNPYLIGNVATGLTHVTALARNGQYLYVGSIGQMEVIDMKGMEVSGLTAHSADIGDLKVRGNENVGGDFTVQGSITAGDNGIKTSGPLSSELGRLRLGTKATIQTTSTEDFDQGISANLGWSTGGFVAWQSTSTDYVTGGYAYQSGPSADNQDTWIQRTVTYVRSGSISFWWKVSSEANFDYLVFCYDSNATCTRTNATSSINGLGGGWSKQTYTVAPGLHTFRWMYSKDGSQSSGMDMGEIDSIEFNGAEDAIQQPTTIFKDQDLGGGKAPLQVISNCATGRAGSEIISGNTTDNRQFTVRCDGTVFADGAYSGSGADFAEYFVATSTLGLPVAGDVVTLDPSKTSGSVILSTTSTRNNTVGVISDKPGFIGNGDHESDTSSAVVVGLLGQIPTHVSAAGGAISTGDELMAGADGVAVKAHGPGMVVGRALDNLTTGTGTIMVLVDPQWWGGDMLTSDASGMRLVDNVTMSASSTASVAQPLVDSSMFTFQGSAWDTSSSAPITSSFSLFANILSTTSSEFTISNTSGTSLFTLNNQGNGAISGDFSVGKRLFLGSKTMGLASQTYLFVDDTLAPSSTYIATNADGWQTMSTYDYAERYESADDLVPGDLVTVDASGINRVKRTASPSDTILGIVSTKPGFVTGKYYKGTFPIALAGRVPTRVSTKNGAIQVGDHLMASDIPGVAVKATGAGNTVGVALESYSDLAEGLISVFVKPGWQGGSITDNGNTQTTITASTVTTSPTITPPQTIRSGLAKIYAGATEVKVTFPSIQSYPLVNLQPYGQVTGGYWITNVSDVGFTINLGQAPTFDLVFAWTVEASQAGNTISFSDNTSATYDTLTGNPVGPMLVPTTTTETVTTTTAATSTTSTTTTSSVDTATSTTSSTTPTTVTATTTTP